MDYFIQHWRGQLSVAKAYWLSGMLRGLLIILPLCILCSYFTAVTVHEQVGQFISVNGWFGFMKTASSPVLLLYFIPSVTSYIWYAVGTWRSCNHFNVEKGSKIIRLLVKILMLIGAISAAIGLLFALFKAINT